VNSHNSATYQDAVHTSTFSGGQSTSHVDISGDDASVWKSPTLVHYGRPNRSVPYLDDDPPPETLGNVIREELAVFKRWLKLGKCEAAPPVVPADIPKWLLRND